MKENYKNWLNGIKCSFKNGFNDTKEKIKELYKDLNCKSNNTVGILFISFISFIIILSFLFITVCPFFFIVGFLRTTFGK